MYTNQLLMGALVHTIKTKFINKFSPTGGCRLLKETVITERREGGEGGWVLGRRTNDERRLHYR